jgi:uncharacterized membrane protein (DUF2068 family)
VPKRGRSDALILAIGIFKLVKAALLVAVATGALEVMHRGGASRSLHEILDWVPVEHYRRVAGWLSREVSALTPHRLLLVSIGAGVYAALFVIEGIGLLMRKRWGEIVTVVITTSFIPLEIYEIIHGASIGKVGALVLNVVIVAYLVWRLRDERREG